MSESDELVGSSVSSSSKKVRCRLVVLFHTEPSDAGKLRRAA